MSNQTVQQANEWTLKAEEAKMRQAQIDAEFNKEVKLADISANKQNVIVKAVADVVKYGLLAAAAIVIYGATAPKNNEE